MTAHTTHISNRMATYISIFGLVLNFIGSLMITFSAIENPSGVHSLINGKKIFLASLDPKILKIGIGTLSIGFLVQLIAYLV